MCATARLYTRFFVIRSPWWDDLFVVLVLVSRSSDQGGRDRNQLQLTVSATAVQRDRIGDHGDMYVLRHTAHGAGISTDRLLRPATEHGMGQHLLLLSASDITVYKEVRPTSPGASHDHALGGAVLVYGG